MWNKVVNRLVTVKSIVTLILTIVFSYLAIVGGVAADQVTNIFMIIIGFYFGSQSERLNNSIKSETE